MSHQNTGFAGFTRAMDNHNPEVEITIDGTTAVYRVVSVTDDTEYGRVVHDRPLGIVTKVLMGSPLATASL